MRGTRVLEGLEMIIDLDPSQKRPDIIVAQELYELADAATHSPASVERVQCFVVNLFVCGKNGRMDEWLDVDFGLQPLISRKHLEVPLRRDDSGRAENLVVHHDS